jgi:hypothetical protein
MTHGYVRTEYDRVPGRPTRRLGASQNEEGFGNVAIVYPDGDLGRWGARDVR